MKQTAYIALGSNVGDREKNLSHAISRLSAIDGVEVQRVARAIETAPVDCPPGSGPFLNSAAELRIDLTIRKFFEHLVSVEKAMGRARSIANSPRTIDLDLLLFGDEIHESPHLSVPHPRLHERAFVLIPLAEIAPQAVHPIFKKSVRELLAELA